MSVWHWYAQHEADDYEDRIEGDVDADTAEEAVARVCERDPAIDEGSWDVWATLKHEPWCNV